MIEGEVNFTDFDNVESYQVALNQKLAAEKAYVTDGSGYWGELITRPDFGCVKFEPSYTETDNDIR